MGKSKNYYIQRFGIKFKQLRAQKGISRRELAERTGFVSTYIAKIEDGIINKPSQEAKDRLCDGLSVTKEERTYLNDDAVLYFYTEDKKAHLEATVPESFNLGGNVSKQILQDYVNQISDENMYVLMYCAQTIYNAENPEAVKEGLQNFTKSQEEYSKKWRKDVNLKARSKADEEYEQKISEYILNNKIKKDNLIITVSEIVENPDTHKTVNYVTKIFKNMCEKNKLLKEKDGKKMIYRINKDKF